MTVLHVLKLWLRRLCPCVLTYETARVFYSILNGTVERRNYRRRRGNSIAIRRKTEGPDLELGLRDPRTKEL